MSLYDLVKAADRVRQGNSARPGGGRIRSPWSASTLTSVAWSDIFGTDTPVPVSRAEAMKVPALSRGRHLLCSTIAGLPLRTYKNDQVVANQPAWLHRTSGGTSPQLRMAWTVDDLIFYGWSLWATERDTSSRITDAVRVPRSDWEFTQDATIEVLGSEVTPESVLLFPGFHEGVLEFADDTIRSAARIERTVGDRAANPIPATELHQTDEGELEDEEVDELVAAYVHARQDPYGAVVYTPHNIELKLHGTAAFELLIQGRNASAIDIARHLGLPASLIDASNVNSTLTYETTQGRSLEFRDYSLQLYTGPIAARLSMDDATPRGTRVGFDAADLITTIPTPAGPATED